MDNARRGARYLIRMPVALTSGRNNVQLMTKNISMHGLFIETDQPPALGYFVVVRLSLPDDLVLSMSGMVIHHASLIPPGLGISFYGADSDSQLRWRRFLNYINDRFPESETEEVILKNEEDLITQRVVRQNYNEYKRDHNVTGQFHLDDLMRCRVTGNISGTDTWQEGSPCKCSSCQAWIMRRLAELGGLNQK